jgi:hypothetical protein
VFEVLDAYLVLYQYRTRINLNIMIISSLCLCWSVVVCCSLHRSRDARSHLLSVGYMDLRPYPDTFVLIQDSNQLDQIHVIAHSFIQSCHHKHQGISSAKTHPQNATPCNTPLPSCSLPALPLSSTTNRSNPAPLPTPHPSATQSYSHSYTARQSSH